MVRRVHEVITLNPPPPGFATRPLVCSFALRIFCLFFFACDGCEWCSCFLFVFPSGSFVGFPPPFLLFLPNRLFSFSSLTLFFVSEEPPFSPRGDKKFLSLDSSFSVLPPPSLSFFPPSAVTVFELALRVPPKHISSHVFSLLRTTWEGDVVFFTGGLVDGVMDSHHTLSPFPSDPFPPRVSTRTLPTRFDFFGVRSFPPQNVTPLIFSPSL